MEVGSGLGLDTTLVVAGGVDVNQLVPLYGDEDHLFTALDGCADTGASRFLKNL